VRKESWKLKILVSEFFGHAVSTLLLTGKSSSEMSRYDNRTQFLWLHKGKAMGVRRIHKIHFTRQATNSIHAAESFFTGAFNHLVSISAQYCIHIILLMDYIAASLIQSTPEQFPYDSF